MRHLLWSATAQRDLRGIIAFYGQYGEEIPNRLIVAVERAALSILEHPKLGPTLPDGDVRAWLARGTPFVLIYRPTQDSIRILKVRHAASDWKPAQ